LETFKTFADFPFDSNRKRMSMIVSHNGKYYLMCKGADNIMIPRIDFKHEIKGLRKKIEFDLHEFAIEGLRTLVMAQKELTKK